jgi:hypothetical protein
MLNIKGKEIQNISEILLEVQHTAMHNIPSGCIINASV